MISHDFARTERLRGFYARYVMAAAEADAPRVVAAFAEVAREPFAGPGPWWVWAFGGYVQTPDDDPAFLYQDTLIALDRARGLNIGQPSLHARLLAAVALEAGESVVQIGAGSGYYTALLAALAGPRGRVDACEIDPGLAARAAANLADRPSVIVHARSGVAGELPPADVVYVNAGATRPERAWLDALKPGGRLLFPLTPDCGQGMGAMLLVTCAAAATDAYPARFVCPAQFIGCEGARDATTARRLAATFAGDGGRAVRSLHTHGLPDGSCWFAGDGWWLSTSVP